MLKDKKPTHGAEDTKVLHLTINGEKFKFHNQYIIGAEIRKFGNIPANDEIYLAIKRPWEDEYISDDTKVDLAREGIEHFFSKKKNEQHLVKIKVNDKEIDISRGKYTVAEIKTKGSVPQTDVLDELIDGKLICLPDDASVLIKGCEQFFSRVRGGVSS